MGFKLMSTWLPLHWTSLSDEAVGISVESGTLPLGWRSLRSPGSRMGCQPAGDSPEGRDSWLLWVEQGGKGEVSEEEAHGMLKDLRDHGIPQY